MGHQLLELFNVANLDLSWWASFFSLLILPFAHEDLAIVLGGFIVVNHIMPVGLVVIGIYVGMVASDFALYGIGAGARRLPWLSRLAVDERVVNLGGVLKRNLFGVVALCRAVPGLVFVALIACGWTRVPLPRFALATFSVSALYLPLMLYLVIVFGDALDDRAGLWAWPLLLCIIIAAGFMRHRVFAFGEAVAPEKAVGATPARSDRRIQVRARYRPSTVHRPRLAPTHAFARAAQWISLR